MHTISKEAYEFLMKAYEEHVERLFDDPTEYADGDPLRNVYDELKKLGEEFELDINTFAMDDDIERLKAFIEKEEGFGFDDDDDWEIAYAAVDLPTWEEYDSYQASEPVETKSIEEKLRQISKDRLTEEQEIVGEWTTYEVKE